MDLVDLLPLVMFASVAILLFTGYPVAFVLGGVALAFGFLGAALGVFKPIEFFNLLPRIWGGIAENLVLVAVPLFVFMGTMLERSDVAADLLRALQVLLRRVPGGLALAVTLMGTIMAATTGIVGASVVMLTMMALPVMLERRYSHELATGTIAAAGTLGILIPPSIMLVIMADLLSLSVGNLFFGAVFPGLLLSGLYLLFIAAFAALRPASAPPMETGEGPATGGELALLLLKSFLPPTFLILLVLGSIFAGWATPTEAAAVGAAGTILLAAVNRRLTLAVLADVCERTGLTCAMIFFIFIGATAFSYVFRSLGGDYVIEDLFAAAGLDSWGILLLIMAIVFVLGFFFDWVEITLIVLPIFAPLVKSLDFGDHVAKPEIVYWFAILLAVNLQTSFLTPPFGFALFYMKGTCPPQIRLGEIYRGIIPFVILQLIGLALCIAFPDIALWLPRTMLD
ncbi:MAG: TRAP transporter large permease subunit [Geminicoccaceae bacterium]|nr:TRAP transporter large permease subunit [Geminicoccaceae bacterium]MCX8101251.1 TRAP transporter large permease subunit [Geminicoccaceae bacterium]MDW8370620.1 TRAP transporter large permease subunit [Geminicoccaceae bacterium]